MLNDIHIGEQTHKLLKEKLFACIASICFVLVPDYFENYGLYEADFLFIIQKKNMVALCNICTVINSASR